MVSVPEVVCEPLGNSVLARLFQNSMIHTPVARALMCRLLCSGLHADRYVLHPTIIHHEYCSQVFSTARLNQCFSYTSHCDFSEHAIPPRQCLAFRLAYHFRPRATFENRYYGPYDKLLNYCFGDTFKFYVAPQNPLRDDNCDIADFIVFLVVFDNNAQPVLNAEVKDNNWAHKAELRYRADKQMPNRYALMLDE